jgi:uncharacterized protein
MKRRLIVALSVIGITLGCQGQPKSGPTVDSQLRLKAEQGDPVAQYKLAAAYEHGEGVPKSLADAVSWYRKSAQQGYAPAQNDLGSVYQFGVGVQRNYAEALKWYQKAVDQQLETAYSNLGYMYDKGLGVPEDKARAAQLYRAGADRGSLEGMLNLGVSYWRGEGVPRDLVQGHMWIDLARAHAKELRVNAVHKRARAAWYDIRMEMSDKEIRTSEGLAKQWWNAKYNPAPAH